MILIVILQPMCQRGKGVNRETRFPA